MTSTRANRATPFLISTDREKKLLPQLQRSLLKTAEHLLGLQKCQQFYAQLETNISAEQFPEQVLGKLTISYQLDLHEEKRIPTSGPCILIANHPFGGVDGLILMALLTRLRPNFKVMANYILSRVPQLRERLISVDPFGGESAARSNLLPLR